jgi:hypothetical protein
MTDDVYPGDSLAGAKDWLRNRLRDGARCPCCTQRAQAYRRTIHASMAQALIRIYHETAFAYTTAPAHVTVIDGNPHVRFADVLDHRQIADAAKLRYWSLIREYPETREDGGRRGLWRITWTGYQFVRVETNVLRYAIVYDGRLLDLEGPPVTIRDCLGKGFDYAALMRGAA